MSDSVIHINNLTLSYEADKPIIQDLSIEVSKGEFIAFLGPSGCGKTTFLRYLSGLFHHDEIYISGKALINKFDPMSGKQLSNRNLGFVFENPALLPFPDPLPTGAIGLQHCHHARPSEPSPSLAQTGTGAGDPAAPPVPYRRDSSG